MSDTPNYGFNRHPRFSVNQLADYLATTNADQRERVIRAAKFPKKIPVVAYSHAKRSICDFLGANRGDLSFFDDPLDRFETRRRREPDGWMRDEMQRNIDAIAAFKRIYSKRRLKRYSFSPGPSDLTMRIEGVRVSVRVDVPVAEVVDEVAYSGGCVLFFANADPSRRNIEARRKSVASMILWALEVSNPNIDPLPRLCMSFDVFGEDIVKAPASTDRWRTHAESACDEAASRWDRVEPPEDYDGPAWR